MRPHRRSGFHHCPARFDAVRAVRVMRFLPTAGPSPSRSNYRWGDHMKALRDVLACCGSAQPALMHTGPCTGYSSPCRGSCSMLLPSTRPHCDARMPPHTRDQRLVTFELPSGPVSLDLDEHLPIHTFARLCIDSGCGMLEVTLSEPVDGLVIWQFGGSSNSLACYRLSFGADARQTALDRLFRHLGEDSKLALLATAYGPLLDSRLLGQPRIWPAYTTDHFTTSSRHGFASLADAIPGHGNDVYSWTWGHAPGALLRETLENPRNSHLNRYFPGGDLRVRWLQHAVGQLLGDGCFVSEFSLSSVSSEVELETCLLLAREWHGSMADLESAARQLAL